MTSSHRVPDGGIPAVYTTRNGVKEAARILSQGTGPIAIDTERASSYRYDDRAFLIQLRRADTPNVLIAPEGIRGDVRELLSPVINGQEWIIHAAATDLACLAWLGLYPGKLFDTEVAARLLGISHPNLAFVTEEFLGIELDKGYGGTDWSRFPLSKAQILYAALDVDTLPELAEEMMYELNEEDKLRWAEEEFAAIVEEFANVTEPAPRSWLDTRGLRAVTEPEGLAVAKAVWEARESEARSTDRAPGQLISNSSVIEIAKTIPRSITSLRRITQLKKRSASELTALVNIINAAADSDPATWPSLPEESQDFPAKQYLKNHAPELNDLIDQLRISRDELAEDLAVIPDSIVSISNLRAAAWAVHGDVSNVYYGHTAATVNNADQLNAFLHEKGLRNWQIEQLVPVLEPLLFTV